MKDALFVFGIIFLLAKGIILKIFCLVIPESYQVIQGSLNKAEPNADQDRFCGTLLQVRSLIYYLQ